MKTLITLPNFISVIISGFSPFSQQKSLTYIPALILTQIPSVCCVFGFIIIHIIHWNCLIPIILFKFCTWNRYRIVLYLTGRRQHNPVLKQSSSTCLAFCAKMKVGQKNAMTHRPLLSKQPNSPWPHSPVRDTWESMRGILYIWPRADIL